MFVAHDGQKALILDASNKDIRGNAATLGVDWAKFSYQIGKKIEENIIDPSLREWFMPAFSTTTKQDQTTASIIMMSTLQKYFSYGCCEFCGLPSVTLLGRKEDWEKMLARLERLKTFGEEPTTWYSLLKPVFTKFVETFDNPESEVIKDFWQKIAHYSGGGSGPTYLSGWITAFCFWNDKGETFYKLGQYLSTSGDSMDSMGDPTPILTLDGARYHRIETEDVPAGYASAPVELIDMGPTNATMVAGSVGIRVTSSGQELESGNGETGFDTIQPITAWWMFETMSNEEFLEKKRLQYEENSKHRSFLGPWEGEKSLWWFGDA